MYPNLASVAGRVKEVITDLKSRHDLIETSCLILLKLMSLLLVQNEMLHQTSLQRQVVKIQPSLVNSKTRFRLKSGGVRIQIKKTLLNRFSPELKQLKKQK